MKNAFLFNLESSFCSQDISNFVLTFHSCRKKGLIRRIRLISKFMTPRPAWQTIPIHIVSNISRRKGNKTMKFSQLVEYNKRNVFLQKSCRE